MNNRTIHTLMAFLTGGAVLLLLVMNPALQRNESPLRTAALQALQRVSLSFGPSFALAMQPEELPDTPLLRVARRLRTRLVRRGFVFPSLPALVSALEEQRTLLHQKTTVTLKFPNGKTGAWEANLQHYPQWMMAVITAQDAHFVLNPSAMAQTLNEEEIPGVIHPIGTTITEVQSDESVLRVNTEIAARSGIVFDVPQAVVTLYDALVHGTPEISLPLREKSGEIANASGVDLGELTLLGTGKSDFAGSPIGRLRNIRKALNEHVNNVLVKPGDTYSFNDTLGGPVTLSRGWYDAKVIFEGVNLRMAPGGGICQTSTTMFRAMLNAGFQEVKRANHSIYVSYYEKNGVGIDATVFPGQQDLTFVNDTGNYLLIQAYDEGTEATVNIYGTPDGRTTAMDGPYFASSDLTDFPADARPPRANEIVWVQKRTLADGQTEDRVILSRYLSGLPRSLAAKYNALHASAVGSGTTMISER